VQHKMNFGVILLIAILGIIFGIIVGALLLVVKIILSERKDKKDFKNKKLLEIKENKNRPKEKEKTIRKKI